MTLLRAEDPKHDRAAARLRTELIGWLTTVDEGLQPQSTPVWFHWDGDSFLIYSRKGSKKLRNLAANPKVSLHLEGNGVGGDNVIFEATAEILEDPAPADRIPGYIEKYGPRIQMYGWTPEGFAADYPDALRLVPTRVRVW